MNFDFSNIDPVSIVFIASFGLIALTALLLTLAVRHDQVVRNSGPQRTLADLEAQIDSKIREKAEIDEELQRRTEALRDFADQQAEVDALIRQRDELLAEHAVLEERKEEIRAMDTETEEAVLKAAEITRDLAEKEEKLNLVQAKLDRADALVSEISQLEEKKLRISEQVQSLSDELSDLRQLERAAEELKNTINDREREASRLEGITQAAEQKESSAKAIAVAAEEKLADLQISSAEALAEDKALSESIRKTEERREFLEARVAFLSSEENRLQGRGTDGDEGTDELEELKKLPPVLERLRGLPEREVEEEADALHRVGKHMKAVGLEYPNRVIRAFHTAMKVNETTQLAVLAGISGTGKSQLPRRYAEAMGIGFLQIPVQPRWDSPQDLMGFYNYIEGRFRPTDMARALYHLDKFHSPEESADLQDRLMLVLLDEMNLARVEYYFSDFLSRLESRPSRMEVDNEILRKDSEIELEIPRKDGGSPPRIFPGYNVLFAGTMNEDESTQSLSDKVVDRANILRFAAPHKIASQTTQGAVLAPEALSYTRWKGWVRNVDHLGQEVDRVEEQVKNLLDRMRGLHRPIGHRMGRAMLSYVANYPQFGGTFDSRIPLADQVELRLLPKLRGVETDLVGNELEDLAEFVDTALNDSELATAIKESIEFAREGSGQFVWRGVARQ